MLDTSSRAIGKRLRTQDNRCTAEPIFVVQQRRRLYGIDPQWTDDIVWIDEEGIEITGEEREEAEREYQDHGTEPEMLTRTGFSDLWEFVTVCLTNEAAEGYIEKNSHNLCDTRVYVESAWKNPEIIAIRKILMNGIIIMPTKK